MLPPIVPKPIHRMLHTCLPNISHSLPISQSLEGSFCSQLHYVAFPRPIVLPNFQRYGCLIRPLASNAWIVHPKLKKYEPMLPRSHISNEILTQSPLDCVRGLGSLIGNDMLQGDSLKIQVFFDHKKKATISSSKAKSMTHPQVREMK